MSFENKIKAINLFIFIKSSCGKKLVEFGIGK